MESNKAWEVIPLSGTPPLGRWTADMIEMIDIRTQIDSSMVRGLVDQLEYPVEIRESKTEQILTEYRKNPNQPILGAHEHGELLGLIGFRYDPPDRTVIRHIVVRRDHRGQGIGKQMIMHVSAVHAFQKITAETDRDAVGFYRRIGFRAESLGEKYPGTERFLCTLATAVQQPDRAAAQESAPGGAAP